jgi:hypothetical protein
LAAGRDSQLAEDVAQVRVDGARADEQLRRHFLRGGPRPPPFGRSSAPAGSAGSPPRRSGCAPAARWRPVPGRRCGARAALACAGVFLQHLAQPVLEGHDRRGVRGW